MIASIIPGTHNPRISTQTETNRLREIGERPPYTMYVLYAAFLFWPSIYTFEPRHEISNNMVCATSIGSDQPANTRSLIRAFASRLKI